MFKDFITGRRKIAKYKKLWKNQKNKAKRYKRLCNKLRNKLEGK
jgi:hypothetical protein